MKPQPKSNLLKVLRESIKKLVFILALTVFSNSSYTQVTDYKTSFSDAEYYFLFNDFAEALPLYLKVLDQDTCNANICYRIGRCYLGIPGLKHMAIPYLEKAIQNINPSYQEGSYKELGAPINSYFYLGEAYRIEGRFVDAIETYFVFRGKLDPKDIYNLEYVNQQIKACERASEMTKSPGKVSTALIHLFNTNKFILGASVSYDSNNLLFTVREKFYDAIYLSTKKSDGNWAIPENITLFLGIEGDVYSTSINHDGSEIFLFRNDNGIGNIYSSVKVDGVWQKAQKLNRKVNTRYWETFASVSPDGQTLYFSSNRRGGAGGLDLYYSLRLPSGDWGDAVNLGTNVNTPHNEEAPQLSPDGNRLYFISQGHNSLGGYDVFYSQKVGNNEWSAPINMGYPISTPDDDMWFFPLGDDKGIVSMVKRDEPNTSNLYLVGISEEEKIERVNIQGELILANNFEVQSKSFSITLIDLCSNDTIHRVNPKDISGEFVLEVSPGSYRLIASGKGYTTASIPIVIPESYSEPDYTLNVRLKPEEIAAGKYLAIKSVLFGFDSDALSEEAVHELEKLNTFLSQNPSVNIEVCGHTDNLGSMAYNRKLSLRRAHSVVNYLVDRGVEASRLKASGMGTNESVALNTYPDGSDNPAGRQLNRRASIRLLNAIEGVELAEELDIPEHLRPRVQNFTILLAPVNTSIDPNKLSSVNSYSGLPSFRLVGRRNSFAYTLGQFDHKSQALSILNYVIDNGFPKAAIVGKDDLNKLIEQ
jgi:outer membrane protein OmpA-like peptidoglycan-associated protein/tetratricopeptide (TPR) repeat protein